MIKAWEVRMQDYFSVLMWTRFAFLCATTDSTCTLLNGCYAIDLG